MTYDCPRSTTWVHSTAGQNLVVMAAVNHVLHFRIFDGAGKVVVDTDEKRLTEKALEIADLRKQLESLWTPHEPTKSEKVRVIDAVTSIVGHTGNEGLSRPGRRHWPARPDRLHSDPPGWILARR